MVIVVYVMIVVHLMIVYVMIEVHLMIVYVMIVCTSDACICGDCLYM